MNEGSREKTQREGFCVRGKEKGVFSNTVAMRNDQCEYNQKKKKTDGSLPFDHQFTLSSPHHSLISVPREWSVCCRRKVQENHQSQNKTDIWHFLASLYNHKINFNSMCKVFRSPFVVNRLPFLAQPLADQFVFSRLHLLSNFFKSRVKR